MKKLLLVLIGITTLGLGSAIASDASKCDTCTSCPHMSSSASQSENKQSGLQPQAKQTWVKERIGRADRY